MPVFGIDRIGEILADEIALDQVADVWSVLGTSTPMPKPSMASPRRMLLEASITKPMSVAPLGMLAAVDDHADLGIVAVDGCDVLGTDVISSGGASALRPLSSSRRSRWDRCLRSGCWSRSNSGWPRPRIVPGR